MEERRRRLLDAVKTRGALSVGEAEKTLSVSRMTIHRDLAALQAQGLVRKVHGGVVAVESHAQRFHPRAQPFEERLIQRREQKKAIAAKVAGLIADASTLLLDASTTTYFLAERLGQRSGAGANRAAARDHYVVTTSLPLLTELLRRNADMRVALTGGEPHARTGTLVGPLAVNSLGDLRFDFAIMSCLGVMVEEGTVFVSSAEEVAIKRAFLSHARRSILACDTGKLGQSGVHPLGRMGEFDYFVTEKAVYDQKAVQAAIRQGRLGDRR